MTIILTFFHLSFTCLPFSTLLKFNSMKIETKMKSNLVENLVSTNRFMIIIGNLVIAAKLIPKICENC